MGSRSDNPAMGCVQETVTVKATRPLESGRGESHAASPRKNTVDPEGLWETNKTAVRFSVRLGLMCRGEGTVAEENSNSQSAAKQKKTAMTNRTIDSRTCNVNEMFSVRFGTVSRRNSGFSVSF